MASVEEIPGTLDPPGLLWVQDEQLVAAHDVGCPVRFIQERLPGRAEQHPADTGEKGSVSPRGLASERHPTNTWEKGSGSPRGLASERHPAEGALAEEPGAPRPLASHLIKGKPRAARPAALGGGCVPGSLREEES